ncbi:hypothetical protein I7I51_07969 [Histoplasma capsulatum]|uniref:Uncharacterized protein n=1 Tax=Ajellomyces capsulatus TaxID=5037 RepID=A0A8A1M274_AJECA|nr:hypothetical protein I7I51_07969 [Histoplasma capsulatum]
MKHLLRSIIRCDKNNKRFTAKTQRKFAVATCAASSSQSQCGVARDSENRGKDGGFRLLRDSHFNLFQVARMERGKMKDTNIATPRLRTSEVHAKASLFPAIAWFSISRGNGGVQTTPYGDIINNNERSKTSRWIKSRRSPLKPSLEFEFSISN